MNYIITCIIDFFLDPLKPHFYYISTGLRGSVLHGDFSLMRCRSFSLKRCVYEVVAKTTSSSVALILLVCELTLQNIKKVYLEVGSHISIFTIMTEGVSLLVIGT